MDPTPISYLTTQLLDLGVQPGGVLLVHTAFSQVRPIEAGPSGLIEALLDALGPEGTLVMPSMVDDDDHPFDPRWSPCEGMGIVAVTLCEWDGAHRSDSPHAFTAVGPLARRITARHPVERPHGPNSPVGRVHDLDGQVLLLGVGHHANTTVHLAEELSDVPYRVPSIARIWRAGMDTTVHYAEPDHCCERFAQLDAWLGDRQRRGPVGHGTGRLMRSRDVVEVAMDRLEEDALVFLHPRGSGCEDCALAWEAVG